MKLSALLRDILFLTTNNGNTNSPPSSNSNPPPTSTPTSPLSSSTTPPPSLLPRQGQGFTDPNLISQPITFYETASALVISNGRTYTTTYIDLISATAAFPVTPTTTTTPLAIETTPIPKPTSPTITNNPVSTSSGAFISAQPSLATSPTITNNPVSTSSGTFLSGPLSLTTTSSTSPILNLSPCSTFTASESALEGCISSVISALSLTGGGPIIATSTSTTTTSTITTTAGGESVTPTTTVTMPYLGKVVAKGEATFVVGGGGVVKESRGVRGRGGGRGRGLLVGVVVGLVVGRGFGGCWEWWVF